MKKWKSLYGLYILSYAKDKRIFFPVGLNKKLFGVYTKLVYTWSEHYFKGQAYGIETIVLI